MIFIKPEEKEEFTSVFFFKLHYLHVCNSTLDDLPWSSRSDEVYSNQTETLLRAINVIPHM